MQIRFIIQARLQSKRLPGKSMAKVGERPIVGHILDRIALLDDPNITTVAAIPEGGSDRLVQFFETEGVPICRGDESDVLSRFLLASEDLQDQDYIVRLTGDNPFVDQREAAALIAELRHQSEPVDLIYPFQLPLGMGFEAFRAGALRSQTENPLEPHHREHVSVFIKENRDRYLIRQIDHFPTHPTIRLTVDYEEDLAMARKTFDHFAGLGNPHFCSQEVYELYQKDPKFFDDNLHMRQNSMQSYEKQ